MSKSIKVNSIVNRVNVDKSILGSSEISSLYGSKYAPLVFKDEVKMIVPGNILGGPIKLQANILTKERLGIIRGQKFGGSNCAYLHLGFVPIVIQSLLVSGNELVKGRCSLVDLSRGSEKTGLIDRFNFKFTKNEPFAAKILTINAPIDINCDTSINSIQILLELEGIDIRTERSVIAVVTGLSCVPTNSTIMLPGLKRETPKWSICNVFNVPEESEEDNERFNSLFNGANPKLIDLGKDTVLDNGKKFGFWGPSVKPVHRRELTTKNIIKEQMSQVMSETVSNLNICEERKKLRNCLERSKSVRGNVSEVGKEEVPVRRSLRVDMEELHRSGRQDARMEGGQQWECEASKYKHDGTEVKDYDGSAESDIREYCRLLGGSRNKLSIDYSGLQCDECEWDRKSDINRWEFQSEDNSGNNEDLHSNPSGSEDIIINAKGGLQEFCELRP
ncbi:movement protein [Actinidia seed borne latent virus]|uniref:Movement protein n=1 Tax=Actinidia seed borne latent virus TaxID=2560282 RepID=A0A2L0V1P2_9VIRU|nr:movement protein [Actinidia seed borne latent virus]AUZ97244.1 movement protein [Actinidia seed borne latent virus]UXL82947.1 movement protein [Actinidia seed borne latent virus]